jgi:DNA polymerase IV
MPSKSLLLGLSEFFSGTMPLPSVAHRESARLDRLQQDVLLSETEQLIRQLAEKAWIASRKETRTAHTVVLKLKTNEFRILTRSHTPSSPPSSCDELPRIALSLRDRVDLGSHQRFRLVGVGLSNFLEPGQVSIQPELFE